MPNEFYGGSTVLSPLSALTGFPIDQLNFLICQLTALALGFPFRKFLSPHTTSPQVRNAVEFVLGAALTIFCFGYQVLHVVLQSTICYLILLFWSRKSMHTLVFAISLLYLAVAHIYRVIYDYGGYTMDITGPLMITTQKISSLAFSYHDGSVKKEEKLSKDQKAQAIKTLPTVLEYYSYLFSFHSIMVGPMVFYNDYKDFIDGSNFRKHRRKDVSGKTEDAQSDPSPNSALMNNLGITLISGFFMVFVMDRVPGEKVYDRAYFDEFSFLGKTLYILVSMSLIRSKYYFAWKLAELVNNAAGLGFNGYDDKGNEKWDLVNNVDIWKLETCGSIKLNIDSWNKTTAVWLRRVVYERMPYGNTAATFAVSAFWHGFYPGYYLAFATAALFTFSGRAMRRNVRPFFRPDGDNSTGLIPFLYDCVTFTFTRLCNVYMVLPFVVLTLDGCVYVYTSMYWWLHIAAALPLLLLPKGKSSRPPAQQAAKKEQ